MQAAPQTLQQQTYFAGMRMRRAEMRLASRADTENGDVFEFTGVPREADDDYEVLLGQPPRSRSRSFFGEPAKADTEACHKLTEVQPEHGSVLCEAANADTEACRKLTEVQCSLEGMRRASLKTVSDSQHSLQLICDAMNKLMAGQARAEHKMDFMANQAREAHRTTQFLLSENSVLRLRQADRQRFAQELNMQHQFGQAQSLASLSLRLDCVVQQQAALIDALGAFSVSFDQPPPFSECAGKTNKPAADWRKTDAEYDELISLLTSHRMQQHEAERQNDTSDGESAAGDTPRLVNEGL